VEAIIARISQPGANHERLAEQVLEHPAWVPAVFAGLQADQARIKFGCAKVLRLVSERQPELLYPHFDVFVRLLDHENKILQWEASFVLSHLARVDREDKFPAIFDRYFSPIPGPVMITAANVIGGAARIALARPRWADRIAREVLKVSRARYQTAECRNVAIGHAIHSLAEFFHLLEDKKAGLDFVHRQRRNSRNAVRKKAEAFLKRHGPAAESAVGRGRHSAAAHETPMRNRGVRRKEDGRRHLQHRSRPTLMASDRAQLKQRLGIRKEADASGHAAKRPRRPERQAEREQVSQSF
jgi:hypothetical protein